MDELWQVNLFRLRLALLPLLCLLLHRNLDFCWSLNTEEKVVRDPYNALSNWNSDDGEKYLCSWLGVECCDGEDETLTIDQVGDISSRKLLQATPIDSSIDEHTQHDPVLVPPLSASPPPPPSDSRSSSPPSPSDSRSSSPPPDSRSSSPPPSDSPSPSPSPTSMFLQPSSQSAPIPQKKSSWLRHRTKWLLLGTIGTAVSIFILSIGILICRSNKVTIVRPWATGLSGQLQKAFVTGVPKLKRSELETACEDFSNVIESSSDGKMYKGTLSSGVEIAVISTTVISAKDWSRHLEAQFRKKIDTLSKVNHKNFVNLLGYCKEDKPFTRMMVFEYAPNGTLFEHLHIKEAEHLGWNARLRIAMGVAYCLEHIHQLNPPVIPTSLNSTAIYLSEDYAAKISGFSFWNGPASANIGVHGAGLLDTQTSDKERNIYHFGIILLEMITGRLPYTLENGQLVDWALEYFRKKQPVKYMVDPILKSFEEEKLEKLCKVIITCIHPDSKQRPTMREVTALLREITAMAPDGATPRLSPLWWAELEILSAVSN